MKFVADIDSAVIQRLALSAFNEMAHVTARMQSLVLFGVKIGDSSLGEIKRPK